MTLFKIASSTSVNSPQLPYPAFFFAITHIALENSVINLFTVITVSPVRL